MKTPDHFALFDLPERFAVDRTELEKRYLALSRELHPDRHATGTPQERLQAVQRTTDLNQAYKVLRDDFLRAEHLLRRHGLETSEKESEDRRQTVDGGLLTEVMELREALADARAAKDERALEAVRADVRARSDRAWVAIRAGFERADDEATRQAIATQLTSLRYYRRILEELANDDEERQK